MDFSVPGLPGKSFKFQLASLIIFFLLQSSVMAVILPHLRDQAMEAIFLTACWKVSWVPPPLPWYSPYSQVMALTSLVQVGLSLST